MAQLPNSLEGRDIASVMHPNVNLRRYQRDGGRVIVGGKGIYVRDSNGVELIDSMSGLWSVGLGYGEDRLADAAYAQLKKLAYFQTSAYKTNEPCIHLAEKLLAIAPVEMSKVHFTNSGSEANDLVAKMVWYRSNALGKPEKKKIVGRMFGYHGVTIASGSITGVPNNHKGFDLPLGMMKHTSCPSYVHFGQPGETEAAFTKRMLDDLETLIETEGPETIAAFWGEPLMGAGGVLVPPEGYWERVQEILRRHNILLVIDEIISGFGRTGNLFACQTYGIEPDVLVLSKQLTSSYLPLSAILMNERFFEPVADHSDEIGSFAHGYTTTGHPAATAVALESIRIIEERDLVQNVRDRSPLFFKRLQGMADHPLGLSCRGIGLIGACEVKPLDGKPAGAAALAVVTAAEEEGVICRAIREAVCFCPPMIISDTEIDLLFDRVLTAMDRLVGRPN